MSDTPENNKEEIVNNNAQQPEPKQDTPSSEAATDQPHQEPGGNDKEQDMAEQAIPSKSPADQRYEEPHGAGQEHVDAEQTDTSEPTAEQLREVSDDVKEETKEMQATISEATAEQFHEVSGGDDREQAEEELHTTDYSQYSESELVKLIKELAGSNDIRQADKTAQELKPHMDELEEQRRKEALQNFIADGSEEDDFEYRSAEQAEAFYAAFRQIRERRHQYHNNLNQERNKNLETKQQILDGLRELVDSEETQVSINKLKEFQKEWRTVGQVPAQQARNLWANYNALLNRFYDNRSIYFELKELDRRKNLEAKQELCQKAEALAENNDLRDAVRQLDELHEEYKHIGPVPQDDQEPLWQRFKSASDVIHDRRREHAEVFKKELQQNMDAKLTLSQEVETYASFTSDSIKEWNQKTKELQAIQKKWEAVGSMSREKAKEVNKKFWSGFKQFFNNKGAFFKRLDASREDNLQQKEALIERAEALKDSDDWQQASNTLKNLQQEWKDVGPVPERQREAVYQRFKAACDHFFERRRNKNKESDSEYEKNLVAKQDICTQIEALASAGSKDTDQLKELSEKYSDIGFVPKNAIKSISQRFDKAVSHFVEKADVDEQQQHELKVETELISMKNSPGADRKMYNKENQLRKRIGRLEDDVALWKNNITFFASSKQADKLKADFEQRIEDATNELSDLKAQLNVVQNMR